jgi:hypothetical protein
MTARASIVDRKAFPGPIHAETRITRIPAAAPSARAPPPNESRA